jgi:PiT family inorganic phosphate transporter
MSDETRDKHTLDKDLGRLADVEEASGFVARGLVAPGLAFVFLLLAAASAAFSVFGEPSAIIVVIAAGIAAYLAMNIGANDVANNVGPAVGAKAITMIGALVLAAIFETAGALIAGGDVVTTISSNLVHSSVVSDPGTLIRLMLAGLVASALWINFSTWIGAPVSTTHSIVGGVVGAGTAAAGIAAVDWISIATIATSWVATPFIGAAVAIAFQAFIKTAIIYQDDKIAAARRWIPLLTAVMGGTFGAYLVAKILPDAGTLPTAFSGFACFVLLWWLTHRSVYFQSKGMENKNRSLRLLFKWPLIGSAALLSFAHGANDVANAVGPLAAIVDAATKATTSDTVHIPFWVMLIGALGISCGLLLYGRKLVRIVGGEITKLNPMRGFSVALAVAVIVIIASWFGLPVSSTHIAVGAVFGVGIFREWYIKNSSHRRAYLKRKRQRKKLERASIDENSLVEDDLEDEDEPRKIPSHEEIVRRRLVRRAHITTIVAAWVTTVPASAGLAALIFYAVGLMS